jgi:hypothetical protein
MAFVMESRYTTVDSLPVPRDSRYAAHIHVLAGMLRKVTCYHQAQILECITLFYYMELTCCSLLQDHDKAAGRVHYGSTVVQWAAP